MGKALLGSESRHPASCLTVSFKTGAFLQEMESLRAANVELYGNHCVEKRGNWGTTGQFPCIGQGFSRGRNALLRGHESL